MKKIIELGQQGSRRKAMDLFHKLSIEDKKKFKQYARENYNPDTYNDILNYFGLTNMNLK